MNKNTSKKEHPIFNAIENNHTEEVRRWVEEGCDLNTTLMNDALTPLMWAVCVCMKPQGMVETLIDLGSSIHQQTLPQSDSALTICSKYGVADVFDDLVLKMGNDFDVNEKNHKGQTVLMMAAEFNGIEVVECILKYKPELRLENNKGENALQISKMKDGYDRSDVIEVLEEAFLKNQIEGEKAGLEQGLAEQMLATNKTIYKL